MNAKPQLVLDIGGVLLTNLSPQLWQQLSVEANVPDNVIASQFKQEVREALWSGKMTEEDFWSWLCVSFPSIDEQKARKLLHANLVALPALSYLPAWSRIADIHLLSNHRSEWVVPALAAVSEYIESITISSSIGFCKPHPEMFEALASRFGAFDRILFVDDQEKNLKPAAKIGWDTLLADSGGAWIGDVSRYLSDPQLDSRNRSAV
ncbi:HAD-IA family hydrolase [Paenibacillus allorhizosphaerae]|uniref:HAD family phosphatase n=1 Tax=Paenibacillus allorhizosphaerae TaxID=2849866 RepID=A0ABN7TJ58_9BACL|nr:HAD-IA family hydrolase [Paenibacillus allorhizosphaerae]CAG7636145.1 hypothetical protein PAECIP111802_02222 [Paenibacillus allorhizosphaerae]